MPLRICSVMLNTAEADRIAAAAVRIARASATARCSALRRAATMPR